MEIKVAKKPDELYKSIEIREPRVEDVIEAQKHDSETKSAAALISQICTFNGQNITMEDVLQLPLSVFLDLQAALMEAGFLGSKEVLSRLLGKDASTIKA